MKEIWHYKLTPNGYVSSRRTVLAAIIYIIGFFVLLYSMVVNSVAFLVLAAGVMGFGGLQAKLSNIKTQK